MQHDAIAQDRRPVARKGDGLTARVDGVLHAGPCAQDPGLRKPCRAWMGQDRETAFPGRSITAGHIHPCARTDGILNRRDDALCAGETDVGRHDDTEREAAVSFRVLRAADLDTVHERRQALVKINLAQRALGAVDARDASLFDERPPDALCVREQRRFPADAQLERGGAGIGISPRIAHRPERLAVHPLILHAACR